MSTLKCRFRVFVAGFVAVWIGNPGIVLAHADILERIILLNREIRESPPSAALYLKRGELHRLHRNWPAALIDYEQAARLEPQNPTVSYYRGRMWFEAGQPERAKPALDRFLAVRPDHADALLVRSRVLAVLGARLSAVDDLTRVITLLDPPTPEVYLERARLLEAQGGTYIDRALAGLDEGIAQLGPLVTLVQFAIEVEQRRGRYLSALARLDGLPRNITAQAPWLGLRGDLLLAAGRIKEARAAYAAGLAIIESYTSTRRALRATQRVETRLRSSLEDMDANR